MQENEPTGEHVNWRYAEVGQMATLDDGTISKCQKKNMYSDSRGRHRTFISLEHARGWFPGTSHLSRKSNCYSRKTWIETESRKSRTKAVVRLYAELKLSKGRLDSVDFVMLGRVYRPDQERPDWTVKRLLKERRIKDMVRDEMAEIVRLKGISPELVIREYEALRQDAKKQGQLAIQKRILDKYVDLLDMMPEEGTSSQSHGVSEDVDLSIYL